MKIIFNLSGNLGGGGLQVAISFINECKNNNLNEYHVFIGSNVIEQIDVNDFPNNFQFYHIPSLKKYKINSYLRKIEAVISPNIVFSIFGPSYFRPKSLHLVGFAQGYYIYPESPFWKTISFKDKIVIWTKKKIHLFCLRNEADAFVCETFDATERLKKIFGTKKKYFTVSNTYNSYFTNPNLDYEFNLPNKEDIEFRFVLISKFYLHKNIQIIPKILDILFTKQIRNIKFVVTIEEDEYNNLFGSKYINNVINVGPIPIHQCPSLYSKCDALFFPSTIECFSASYPEAMIMKKPIITSDLGFARSICGNAALYFDPTNINDIIAKILELIDNKPLQSELIENAIKRVKDFPSAFDRANEYLSICAELINDKH